MPRATRAAGPEHGSKARAAKQVGSDMLASRLPCEVGENPELSLCSRPADQDQHQNLGEA
jgi:hypothetical protein